ncbi:MAG: hypothetical protein HW401_284 [Parcubacteria group bacterium]|nr:hypothetical protein [Parcubacteria group bacterium]
MSLKKIIIAISFLFLPIAALASDIAAFDVPFLSDKMKSIIEIVNLFLALLAAFYAIKLAALAQGGQMERTWNMLALASVIFGFIQVSNSLKGFGIMDIHGVTELFELLLAFVLVYVFIRTKKMLLK